MKLDKIVEGDSITFKANGRYYTKTVVRTMLTEIYVKTYVNGNLDVVWPEEVTHVNGISTKVEIP